MPEYIEITPDWDGMRRWVRALFVTDPDVAMDVIRAMACEAPIPFDNAPVEDEA